MFCEVTYCAICQTEIYRRVLRMGSKRERTRVDVCADCITGVASELHVTARSVRHGVAFHFSRFAERNSLAGAER